MATNVNADDNTYVTGRPFDPITSLKHRCDLNPATDNPTCEHIASGLPTLEKGTKLLGSMQARALHVTVVRA